MAFDSDTEYMIELDVTEGAPATEYTNVLQYIIDLAQRVSSPTKKDYVSISGGGNTEANVNSGITNFKQRNPQIGFVAYFSKRDKSNFSFHNAVDAGEVTISGDERFFGLSINDADTGADEFTVSGDITDRLESGGKIVVEGSTGNDDIYDVTGVSYDSGADETTISVSQNVSDGTADGVLSDGIKTIVEQKTWLEEYVFDGSLGEEYVLKGPDFTDTVAGGRRCVVKNAGIERNSNQPFTGTGVLKCGEGFNTG